MFDLFKAKAEAVSAEVHRFHAESQALDFIAGALRMEGIADTSSSWAVWCDGPLRREAERQGLPARIPGLHLEVTRARAAGSKVGISEFDWAIADTGTLLPDLAALLERVDPARMRYLACVTGPSRTADIERVLTIGVHGPRRLVIVAVDEEGRAVS
jgi:L-lactate dehydrogenase complex protein LldG